MLTRTQAAVASPAKSVRAPSHGELMQGCCQRVDEQSSSDITFISGVIGACSDMGEFERIEREQAAIAERARAPTKSRANVELVGETCDGRLAFAH
jgi:hypothetical protein